MIDVEDAAVLLRVRSIGRSTENKSGETVLPCLFVLHAGGGVEKARISMDLNHWREWFGPEMRDEFVERLQAVQGLLHRRRDAEFAILEPAHLSGPTQQLLRDILVGFAHQSQESLGR